MMEQKYEYNTIEEALEDLRAGRIILVTDDPDRENEGDMICAAQFATQENMNFMDMSMIKRETDSGKDRGMNHSLIREY